MTDECQLELTDLQCYDSLKLNVQFEFTDFYKKHLLPSNFICNYLFASTYGSEQLFSIMKYTKSFKNNIA